jgi:hypothetical protein
MTHAMLEAFPWLAYIVVADSIIACNSFVADAYDAIVLVGMGLRISCDGDILFNHCDRSHRSNHVS